MRNIKQFESFQRNNINIIDVILELEDYGGFEITHSIDYDIPSTIKLYIDIQFSELKSDMLTSLYLVLSTLIKYYGSRVVIKTNKGINISIDTGFTKIDISRFIRDTLINKYDFDKNMHNINNEYKTSEVLLDICDMLNNRYGDIFNIRYIRDCVHIFINNKHLVLTENEDRNSIYLF